MGVPPGLKKAPGPFLGAASSGCHRGSWLLKLKGSQINVDFESHEKAEMGFYTIPFGMILGLTIKYRDNMGLYWG